MRYSINLKIEYMKKDMDFYLLLKTWVHNQAVNMVKNLLTVQKNQQQMQ